MSKIDLNKLVIDFNSSNEKPYFVSHAVRFSDTVAVVDINTMIFRAGLDIDSEGDIYLVFRDADSREMFNFYTHNRFEQRQRIYRHGRDDCKIKNVVITGRDLLVILREVIREMLQFHETVQRDYAIKKQSALAEMTKQATERDIENRVWDDMARFFRGKRLTIPETVRWLKEKNCSLTRFGDGEIMLMFNEGIYYQYANPVLMRELREISAKQHDTLVCYPGPCAESPFWRQFWRMNWFRCKYFADQPVWGDTDVSRPEGFKQYGQELADAWLDLFRDKHVCIVTGSNSRLDPEHYLFSEVKSKEIIFARNNNAYDDVDDLVVQCTEKVNIDLYLIALGPAGTVLSSRLSGLNCVALDIGHLTNSYDNVFLNQPSPESLPRGF